MWPFEHLFAYETIIRSNVRFRPQPSIGTDVTGNPQRWAQAIHRVALHPPAHHLAPVGAAG
jgi:DNA integrity scanning protein DisA with diadenylate cyclase activity